MLLESNSWVLEKDKVIKHFLTHSIHILYHSIRKTITFKNKVSHWEVRKVPKSLKMIIFILFQEILDRPGVDPNATAVRGALAGTVAGSTPPVLLAATRGYYKVVDVFKSYYR